MGQKATWILLRGLGRESGHWGPFTDQFRAAFPEHRVLTLDLPGTGVERERKCPSTIQAIVSDLERRKAELHQGSYYVLGFSMSGVVALEWATRRPIGLCGTVLVNPAFGGGAKQVLDLSRLATLTKVIKSAFIKGEREREESLLRIVSRVPERHANLVAHWTKLAKERPISRATVGRQILAVARYRLPKFSKPDLPPMLCLTSLGDDLVDPRSGHRLKEATGAHLRFHPWAGHELTLDDPDWVLNEVRKWLYEALPKS